MSVASYYGDSAVKERLAEYCGGTAGDPSSFTAEYLVGYGEDLVRAGSPEPFVSASRDDFTGLLARNLDVFRSNWDRAGTLGVLDVEYVNPDFPGEIYLNPARCFEALEPTRRAVRITLEKFRIPFLEIMTGQGYHFTTRVARGSGADAELIALGSITDSLAGKYAHPPPGSRRQRFVSRLHGQSFEGMGRMMEYVAHAVLRIARPQSRIPLVTTDVAVGNAERGREAVSVDLSMYADPIYMRDIRCPFSTHQKHKVEVQKVGSDVAESIPVQVCVPTGNLPLDRLLAMRRDFDACAAWARECGSTAIPDGSEGFQHLVEEYRRSRLAEFHRSFDSAGHDHWTSWPRTYDRLDSRRLPPCIAFSLDHPNPHLLKPTNLQSLTRTLMGAGWHPRHIAGLVRSKYERDHGWKGGWSKYDAATRADFYVRLFAGQVAVGLDLLLDHNCISHQQKGYCIKPWCGFSLGEFRL